jgi:hypothetical protein
MDCGQSIEEKYPRRHILENNKELKKIVNEITDVNFLGTAIFSAWRYYNHWAYSASEIAEPEVRDWFIIAFTRLIQLTTTGRVQKILKQ